MIIIIIVRSAVNDCKWLDGKFLEDVQDRGAAIIKAREKSSAASAASAAVDHMRSWALGTAPVTSLGAHPSIHPSSSSFLLTRV
jgi:malate/lactate dehydrogenase